jgi:N-acetylglucosamine kinase-like BadF-type ATPase
VNPPSRSTFRRGARERQQLDQRIMIYVLGIDAGGTKTVCHLADEHGTLIAEARAGGANLQAAGELQVEKVLHDVMEAAIGDRDIVPSAICLGIAGVDRHDDAAVVRGIMRRIGFKARILVVNDALVALEAGAPGDPGVVIISGTGSIAYGRNRRNQGARAGGWGHVLGDEGSGYWIGRAALRAVLREADRRGPRTALTPLLLRHFDVAEAPGLIHEVYQNRLVPAAIGSLAECVQAAFTSGDATATGILKAAADELEAAGVGVARRLELDREPFTFILGGGIFRAVPWLREELQRRLPLAIPVATARVLDREPASGAVSLAIQEARGGAAIPAYKVD